LNDREVRYWVAGGLECVFTQGSRHGELDVPSYLAKKDLVLTHLKGYRRREFCDETEDAGLESNTDAALRKFEKERCWPPRSKDYARAESILMAGHEAELEDMAVEAVRFEANSTFLFEELREEINGRLGESYTRLPSGFLIQWLDEQAGRNIFRDRALVEEKRTKLTDKLQRLEQGEETIAAFIAQASTDH
jgi:hypothetical protein